MRDPLVIQILLIVGLAGLIFVLLVQRPGARPQAIRRLTYLAMLLAAVAAVIFPEWLTRVARLVGVGRGADLLLYGLVLVFISHSIASKQRHAANDRKVTEMVRIIAIAAAEPAAAAGRRLTAVEG